MKGIGVNDQHRAAFARSSKARLTCRDLGRFPGESVFDRLGRAACRAGCLPRKELYEAWETARRARRLFRGGRVVDLAGGHGLLAQVMLLLDDTSREAVVVDRVLPPSAASVHAALLDAWPRLAGRVTFVAGELEDIRLMESDVVVSNHACGRLTDVVIDMAVAAGARLAVLPCCHDLAKCDPGALAGWLEPPLAIDVVRALRLQQHGYRVWTREIPAEITPKNRLLLAAPAAGA